MARNLRLRIQMLHLAMWMFSNHFFLILGPINCFSHFSILHSYVIDLERCHVFFCFLVLAHLPLIVSDSIKNVLIHSEPNSDFVSVALSQTFLPRFTHHSSDDFPNKFKMVRIWSLESLLKHDFNLKSLASHPSPPLPQQLLSPAQSWRNFAPAKTSLYLLPQQLKTSMEQSSKTNTFTLKRFSL